MLGFYKSIFHFRIQQQWGSSTLDTGEAKTRCESCQIVHCSTCQNTCLFARNESYAQRYEATEFDA